MMENDCYNLVDGMIIKTREGNERIILHNKLIRYINTSDLYTVMDVNLEEHYNKDLTHYLHYEKDIVAIYDNMHNLLWKREETDWSKVKPDTKVYVTNVRDGSWEKRYFKSYDENKKYPFCTYIAGQTSWSSNGECGYWKYCELAEGEKQ